jgi:hypothetical protein
VKLVFPSHRSLATQTGARGSLSVSAWWELSSQAMTPIAKERRGLLTPGV